MTDNYIKILEELEPFGVGEERDIASLISAVFNRPQSDWDFDLPKEANDAFSLLSKLKSNGHIEFGDSLFQNIENAIRKNKSWFDSEPLPIRLTKDGFLFLFTIRNLKANEDLHKSVIAANASVIDTNISVKESSAETVKNLKSQKGLFRLTFFIAAIGAFSQVGSFYIDLKIPRKNLKKNRQQKNQEA